MLYHVLCLFFFFLSALKLGNLTAACFSLRKTASSRPKRSLDASTTASPTARTGAASRRSDGLFDAFESMLRNSFFYFEPLCMHLIERVWSRIFRPRFTVNTGSRAASRPAVVRTQKAAAAHQSRHTNPPTMKASSTLYYISVIKACLHY